MDRSGAKRWVFMFRWTGKLKEMGLGGTSSVTLAKARASADEARKILGDGRSPIELRRAEAAKQGEGATFGAFADALTADPCAGSKNAKHRAQWEMTLKVYAASLRPMALDEVKTEHVLEVLKPIWLTKSETASRVRGRIERVLNAAAAEGLRSGPNPQLSGEAISASCCHAAAN